MNVRASQVFAAIVAAIVGITPLVGDDGFVCVNNVGDVDALERDRIFCVVPVSGPFPTSGRGRCSDTFIVSIGVRYFDAEESRKRMLDDVPLIVAALRRLSHVLPGIQQPVVTSPTYDYRFFAGENSVLVTFGLSVSYHVDVGQPGA